MANNQQGRKDDNGKVKLSIIPVKPLIEIAKVMMFGSEKYGRNNWCNLPHGCERYYDAALRHMTQYYQAEFDGEGSVLDDESGLHHLAHAAACLIFGLWHSTSTSRDIDKATGKRALEGAPDDVHREFATSLKQALVGLAARPDLAMPQPQRHEEGK